MTSNKKCFNEQTDFLKIFVVIGRVLIEKTEMYSYEVLFEETLKSMLFGVYRNAWRDIREEDETDDGCYMFESSTMSTITIMSTLSSDDTIDDVQNKTLPRISSLGSLDSFEEFCAEVCGSSEIGTKFCIH